MNIGSLDIEKYKLATDKKIVTDGVILTENRKEHIIKRRGQAFYEEYSEYFSEIICNPDYIFKDERIDTAIACKTFIKHNESVNLVVRLAVESDNPEYKNSIITAIKENNKRFAQRLRNNIPIYKKIDKKE